MVRRRKIAAGLFVSLVAGLFALAAPQAPTASAVNGNIPGWSAVGGGLTGTNNPRVFSLVRDSAGYLYAGGSFNGGLSRVSNSAGASWSPFASGVSGGSYPWVFSLAVDSATPNNLFVGGAFTTPTYLRKIDTSTGNPTTLPSIAAGTYSYDGVEEIAVISNSQVFIGGGQSLANGQSATEGLAMLNGTTFTAVAGGLSRGTDAFKIVNALATHAGLLYVGGQFSSVSNSAVVGNRIAVYNPTTSAWSALGGSTYGPAGSTRPLVAAIAVKDANNVFAGGNFVSMQNAGSVVSNTNRLAKWDGSN